MWRRSRGPAPQPRPRPAPPGLAEAQSAWAGARAELEAVIDKGPEVREVARQVREQGRRNHWAEAIARAATARRA